MSSVERASAFFSSADLDRARSIVEGAKSRDWLLATAESCTGGLVAALLTEVPGSSAVVDRGFVTYSNDAKVALLDVPADLIERYGAVSAQTAEAMALGALRHSRATCAVSITGIAGPDGGSEQKPVGLVHFGLAHRSGRLELVERRFPLAGRSSVRLAALREALSLFAEALA